MKNDELKETMTVSTTGKIKKTVVSQPIEWTIARKRLGRYSLDRCTKDPSQNAGIGSNQKKGQQSQRHNDGSAPRKIQLN